MDAWRWAAACAALWALAGCQTPQAITALERECRMLEDQIYMLQDELDRSQEQLQACQSASPRASRAAETPARPAAEAESSRLPPLRGPRSTSENGNGRSPVDVKSLQLPDIEVPGQALPSGAFPKTLAPRNGGAPASPSGSPRGVQGLADPNNMPSTLPPQPRKTSANGRWGHSPRYAQEARSSQDLRSTPDPRDYAGNEVPPRRLSAPRDASARRMEDPRVIPAQAIALDPRADNTRVDRITLNRAATGGYDRDARLGDAGVTVLVEPRDAHGELAPAAGPVSVVILDGGRSGKSARVARWDFTTEQVASLYRKSPYGEGIYLEMPWPGSPPERSHLQMFVRYTTQDGRNLEASQELDVAVPRYRQKSWTPLSPSAAGPAPVETARTWQPKPFRAEDPTVQPAVAEEPIIESTARVTPKARGARTASFAEKSAPVDAGHSTSLSASASADKVASNAESASGAQEQGAKLQRPVWSPLRQ